MRHQLLNTASAVILLDQVTKFVAMQTGVVTFNPGISFGFAAGSGQVALFFVTVVLLVGVWYWQQSLWQKYPVIAGMLFGGGISNLVDRMLFGGVRDWLPVPGFELTNNMADWSISVAIAALLLMEMKLMKTKGIKKGRHAD